MDAGDIVSVVDKDGNNLSVYVMERVVRITGGLAEELHCYGETETAHVLNKSPLVTSFNNKINEAIKTASDYINNTKGVFEWIDNGDGTNGGFTIYETDDDKSWLRCTAGGIGISADGGLTYTNAITKDGVTATQLQVIKDGVSILRTEVIEGTNSLQTNIWMRDYVHDNTALRLYSMSGETSLNERYATSGLQINTPLEGKVLMSVTATSYEGGSGYHPTISFFDPLASTSEVISLQAWTSSGGNNIAHMELRRADGNPLIGFQSVDFTPYLNVYSTTYGLKNLVLRPIAINGTTYYIMAST